MSAARGMPPGYAGQEPGPRGIPGSPGPGAEVAVSFEDMYRAERPGLIAYLVTMGADQDQAADAVQAAFASAFGRWDAIREHRAWLYKVALREVYRADVSRQEVLAGDQLPDVPGLLDSADIAVLNEEEEMVRAAVAALPGRQRQVMALMLAGFTAPEIAEALGCDHAAVRQAQVRARDSLARQLGMDRRNA